MTHSISLSMAFSKESAMQEVVICGLRNSSPSKVSDMSPSPEQFEVVERSTPILSCFKNHCYHDDKQKWWHIHFESRISSSSINSCETHIIPKWFNKSMEFVWDPWCVRSTTDPQPWYELVNPETFWPWDIILYLENTNMLKNRLQTDNE